MEWYHHKRDSLDASARGVQLGCAFAEIMTVRARRPFRAACGRWWVSVRFRFWFAIIYLGV